jgi:hypothetical protein
MFLSVGCAEDRAPDTPAFSQMSAPSQNKSAWSSSSRQITNSFASQLARGPDLVAVKRRAAIERGD